MVRLALLLIFLAWPTYAATFVLGEGELALSRAWCEYDGTNCQDRLDDITVDVFALWEVDDNQRYRALEVTIDAGDYRSTWSATTDLWDNSPGWALGYPVAWWPDLPQGASLALTRDADEMLPSFEADLHAARLGTHQFFLSPYRWRGADPRDDGLYPTWRITEVWPPYVELDAVAWHRSDFRPGEHVPEPSGLVLAILAALLFSGKRRGSRPESQ